VRLGAGKRHQRLNLASLQFGHRVAAGKSGIARTVRGRPMVFSMARIVAAKVG
jgi:hypothetical protein